MGLRSIFDFARISEGDHSFCVKVHKTCLLRMLELHQSFSNKKFTSFAFLLNNSLKTLLKYFASPKQTRKKKNRESFCHHWRIIFWKIGIKPLWNRQRWAPTSYSVWSNFKVVNLNAYSEHMIIDTVMAFIVSNLASSFS